MKTKPLFLIIYIITFIITAVNLFFTIKSSLFADISKLPEGEILYTSTSPVGNKALNVYRIENALGTAIRAELIQNNNGKTSNVFWQTGIDNVEVYWEDNDVAVINKIPLNVSNGGFYDCRNGVSLFREGAIEGEGFVDEQGNIIPKK